MYKERKTCLILLSGGIDSTALIRYYLDLDFKVLTNFLDYGQAASENELESAVAVSEYFNVPLEIQRFGKDTSYLAGEIVGRNAFLVFSILLNLRSFVGIISLGIHSGTPYYDCSDEFVKAMNQIIGNYTSGNVTLDAPFISWDKRDIVQYSKNKNIPIQLTYSCENGTNPPCGMCDSCKDRRALGVF